MPADGIRDGITLCLTSVIPALFPFLLLAPLLLDSILSLCRTLTPAQALLLSACCGWSFGYPTGLLCLLRMYRAGILSKETAERASGICSTASPVFLVGYAGSALLASPCIGWCYLCIVTLLSLLLLLPLLVPLRGLAPVPVKTEHRPAGARLSETVLLMLDISVRIVLCSAVRAVLAAAARLLGLPLTVSVLLAGFSELSGGLADAAVLAPGIREVLSLFFIGSGGCAVLLQLSGLLRREGLSVRYCLSAKLLTGGLAALSAVLCF